MKDLLEAIAGVFPAFFRDFLGMLTGPKQFLRERLADKARVQKALLFLGISAALNFLLKTPLLRGEPWLEVSSTAAFTLLLWTSVAVLVWLACRCVGGKGSLEGTVVISFHNAAVLEFILSFSSLVSMGLLRTTDPALYSQVMTSAFEGRLLVFASNSNLFQNTNWRLFTAIVFLGGMAAVAWMFVAWGAYRSFHRIEKVRSGLAFVIAGVGWLPLWAVTLLLANALLK
jgi:hypothetical protein